MYQNMTELIAQMPDLPLLSQNQSQRAGMILLNESGRIKEKESFVSQRQEEFAAVMAAFENGNNSRDIHDAYETYVTAKGIFDEFIDRLVEQAHSNNDTQVLALLLSDKFYQAEQDEQIAILRLVQLKSDDAKAKSADNTELTNGAVAGMIWIIADCMVLALLFGIPIFRSISNLVKAQCVQC